MEQVVVPSPAYTEQYPLRRNRERGQINPAVGVFAIASVLFCCSLVFLQMYYN